MKVLLVYPPTPDTFWSFKHVLRFVIDLRHYVTMSVQFSRGCPFDCEFCDIVVMNGRVPRTKSPAQLIAELEQLRLHGWQDTVFLVNGYRELMKELYEPRDYYQRIRTFLEHNRPQGPRLRLAWSDFQAFVKSLWLLGVGHRARRAYWRFCLTTLLRRPRQLHQAITLTIIGHHFRRVAQSL